MVFVGVTANAYLGPSALTDNTDLSALCHIV